MLARGQDFVIDINDDVHSPDDHERRAIREPKKLKRIKRRRSQRERRRRSPRERRSRSGSSRSRAKSDADPARALQINSPLVRRRPSRQSFQKFQRAKRRREVRWKNYCNAAAQGPHKRHADPLVDEVPDGPPELPEVERGCSPLVKCILIGILALLAIVGLILFFSPGPKAAQPVVKLLDCVRTTLEQEEPKVASSRSWTPWIVKTIGVTAAVGSGYYFRDYLLGFIPESWKIWGPTECGPTEILENGSCQPLVDIEAACAARGKVLIEGECRTPPSVWSWPWIVSATASIPMIGGTIYWMHKKYWTRPRNQGPLQVRTSPTASTNPLAHQASSPPAAPKFTAGQPKGQTSSEPLRNNNQAGPSSIPPQPRRLPAQHETADRRRREAADRRRREEAERSRRERERVALAQRLQVQENSVPRAPASSGRRREHFPYTSARLNRLSPNVDRQQLPASQTDIEFEQVLQGLNAYIKYMWIQASEPVLGFRRLREEYYKAQWRVQDESRAELAHILAGAYGEGNRFHTGIEQPIETAVWHYLLACDRVSLALSQQDLKKYDPAYSWEEKLTSAQLRQVRIFPSRDLMDRLIARKKENSVLLFGKSWRTAMDQSGVLHQDYELDQYGMKKFVSIIKEIREGTIDSTSSDWFVLYCPTCEIRPVTDYELDRDGNPELCHAAVLKDSGKSGADQTQIEKLPVEVFEARPPGTSSGDPTKGEPDKCSVCQEEFKSGDRIRRLPCDHTFHLSCVDKWLGIHNQCPNCRKPAIKDAKI